MFDNISNDNGHIVVVMSPLINLMEDQVKYLQSLGLSAVNFSSDSETDFFKHRERTIFHCILLTYSMAYE